MVPGPSCTIGLQPTPLSISPAGSRAVQLRPVSMEWVGLTMSHHITCSWATRRR